MISLTNELIFLFHTLIISASTLFSLWLGKEALYACISVQCLLANLFVIKQTTLLGFNATCSDAFSVGVVLGLNLLQEFYGKETVRRAIWVSFFLLIFYAFVSFIHCSYLPSRYDTAHVQYAAILTHMPRIVVASFITYLIVQQWDVLFFATLRRWFAGSYLPLRLMLSLSISQLLDTILFSFLGLYGLIAPLTDIIVVSYSIKLAAIAVAVPCVWIAKKFFPQAVPNVQ